MYRRVNGLVIVLSCVYGMAISSAVNLECSSNQQCQGKNESFCCGNCESTYCCSKASLEYDEKKCDLENSALNDSAKMLGVIIGGMIFSFSGAMFIHALIRRIILKRKRENRNGENGMPLDNLQTRPSASISVDFEVALPSYNDIHLYKKVDRNQNTASTLLQKSGNLSDKIRKAKNDGYTLEDANESTSPPPPYSISAQIRKHQLERSCSLMPSTSKDTQSQLVLSSSNATDSTADKNVSHSSQNSQIASASQSADIAENSSQGNTLEKEAESSEEERSRENVLGMVINLLKTLESSGNSTDNQEVIRSAKQYLDKVAHGDSTPESSES